MDEWRPVPPVDDHPDVIVPEQPWTRRARHVRDLLRWFGPGRLVTALVTLPLITVGAYFLLRIPETPVESKIAYATTVAPGEIDSNRLARTREAESGITVHVAGHVHSPGVYVLTDGHRIVDAIRAAGGAQPIADLNAINLALTIDDGDQVYVPAIGEVDTATTVGRVGVNGPDGATTFPIDINSASAVELDELPGIGPSTAAAIVGHREKFGAFASASGLLDVPGIGPSKFEAIKDLVTT